MKENITDKQTKSGLTRRHFLAVAAGGGVGVFAGLVVLPWLRSARFLSDVFIAKVRDYGRNLAGVVSGGLRELGIRPEEIRGKRILLKPNLVETRFGVGHINTNPLVVRGAIEAFLAWGAAEVLVAEGPGHCRDSLLLVEECGLSEVLKEDRIRFIDLNYDDVVSVPNGSGWSKLKSLLIPRTVKEADWVVSMPKMKTHHWTGVTLAMKNLFGVMPGSYYGWPKNVLHWAGIEQSILDINAALKPNLAIVDGIVGMEGDGPIMGDPRPAQVIVMGRNLPAVDATCARIMGVNPSKVPFLEAADGTLGTIRTGNIAQKGETVESVRTDFALVDGIPAHKGLRL